MITIIDFISSEDNILNLHSLSKDVLGLIDECDSMRTSGFSTLLGYVGNQLRFEALISFKPKISYNGSIINNTKYFSIDSIGGINKQGINIQWVK